MASPTAPKNPTPPSLGGPTDPQGPVISWRMLLVLIAMITAMMLWRTSSEGGSRPSIDYSTFFQMVQEDKVESVRFRGQRIEGSFSNPTTVEGESVSKFRSFAPDKDEELLPLLREKKVKVSVESEDQPFALQFLFAILPWVLIIGLWWWLSRGARKMMSGGPGGLGMLKGKSRQVDRKTMVNVGFGDVAGLANAKKDLGEVVEFLRSPESFQRLGGTVPRGVLLVGPPGTGKTLLARAVAGESKVPFFAISASEFVEMFVGVGAARVRELFEDAKKNAPSIIFIDEIDAVGRSRGAGFGGGHDEREQTLNQLLSEMDGFDRSDLVIVMAATNRPDVLDPALLRPGRFDRRVVVDRPELAARKAILEVHTRKKPLDEDVDLQSVAVNTAGFSGADLANLCNEAALNATRRGAEELHHSDFLAAYDKIVLGDPRETKLDEVERKRIAVHEAGHAIAAHFSPEAESLERVSIIPRGMALGVTQQSPGGDRHLMTRAQLEARLRVLLGGYAAERLVLGDVSTGAENDLKEATKIASKMIAHFGMSETMGPIYLEHGVEHAFLGQKIATDSGASDQMVFAIETETRALAKEALQGATEILDEHRDELDVLVGALLERETLEKGELGELLD